MEIEQEADSIKYPEFFEALKAKACEKYYPFLVQELEFLSIEDLLCLTEEDIFQVESNESRIILKEILAKFVPKEEFPMNSLGTWLLNLKLEKYLDVFRENGFKLDQGLDQLKESIFDLYKFSKIDQSDVILIIENYLNCSSFREWLEFIGLGKVYPLLLLNGLYSKEKILEKISAPSDFNSLGINKKGIQLKLFRRISFKDEGTSVEDFLKINNLDPYIQSFVEDHGFQDIEDLIVMKDKLEEIGVKLGAKKRLQRLLEKLTPIYSTLKSNASTPTSRLPTLESKIYPSAKNNFQLDPSLSKLHSIPGLYCLLSIHEDEQNQSLVEKTLLDREEIARFCNDLVPNSSKDKASIISFDLLNSISSAIYGFYGHSNVILQSLNTLNILSSEECSKLNSTLKSGLYTLVLNSNYDRILFLIFWPEKQSFSEHKPSSTSCKLFAFLKSLSHRVFSCLDKEMISELEIQSKSSRQNRMTSFKIETKVTQEDSVIMNEGFSFSPEFDYSHECEHRMILGSQRTALYSQKILPSDRRVKRGYKFTCENPSHLKEEAENYNIYFHIDNQKKESFAKWHFEAANDLFSKIGEMSANIRRECDNEYEKQMAEYEKKQGEIRSNITKAFQAYVFENYPKLYEADSSFPKVQTKYEASFQNTIHWNNHKLQLKTWNRYLWAVAYTTNFSDSEKKKPNEEEQFIEEVVINNGNLYSSLDAFLSQYSKRWFNPFYSYPTREKVREAIQNFIKENSKVIELPQNENLRHKLLEEFGREYNHQLNTILSSLNNRYHNLYGNAPNKSDISKFYEKNIQEKKIQMIDNALFEEFPHLMDQLSLTITDFNLLWNKATFTCDKEFIYEDCFLFSFYQLNLPAKTIEDLQQNLNLSIQPTMKYIGEIRITAKAEIVALFYLTNQRILYVYNIENRSSIEIYSLQHKKNIFNSQFGKPVKLATFDEKSRLLIMYYEAGNKYLITFRFNEEFKLYSNLGLLQLDFFGEPSELKQISFLSSQKLVLLLDISNRVRIFNPQDKRILKQQIDPRNFDNINENEVVEIFLIPSSNGECFFLAKKNKRNSIEEDDFITLEPYLTSSMQPFPQKILEIPQFNANYITSICMTQYGNSTHYQQHLQQFDISSKILRSMRINITTKEESFGVQRKEEISKENKDISLHKPPSKTPLDYIFHVIDKFATENLLEGTSPPLYLTVIGDCMETSFLSSKVENKLKEILRILDKTEKPLNKLGLMNNLNCVTLKDLSIDYFHSNLSSPLGNWIRQLICLVPLQVTRAEGNELLVLSDGLLVPLETRRNTLDHALQIKLGLYDAVLSNWNGPIKVVSSMGKQSTGKSYSLNHLTGSFFDISGKRCTDGCWMTMRETKECLYIILDFEGLGSFERTEQEDMLLSVMNAAISNLTLFKTEFRLDRDIEQMFSKFQSGVDLIKGSDKLFKGHFYIVIKDVADRDIQELTEEFQSKLVKISNDNKGNNFISRMYQDGFSVFPFPPIGKSEYYEELKTIQAELNRCPPQFTSGAMFREVFTHLMSKIALKDWTSLDRHEINVRLHLLSQQLPTAVVYGRLSNDNTGFMQDELSSLDHKAIIPDSNFEMEIGNKSKFIDLLDSKVVLQYEGSVKMDFFQKFFEEKVLQRNGENFKEWQVLFVEFIQKIVSRRINRIHEWIDLNTRKWKEDGDVANLNDNVEKLLNQLKKQWELCLSKCDSCYLACLKPKHHEDLSHNCCQEDHYCKDICSFCSDNQEKVQCGYKMGHSNRHNCMKKPHTCGERCHLIKYANCNELCNLDLGHQGSHRCSASTHLCNELCSSKNCKGLCINNAEKTHTVHKCMETNCSKSCCMNRCPYPCNIGDHFHGDEKLSKQFALENGLKWDKWETLDHFCSHDHPCPEKCSIKGICDVKIELVREKVEETFVGKRGEFKYQAVREANGERKLCCQRIPPKQKKHDGVHVHTLDERALHYCETTCPACGYFCELEYGHSQKLHKTSHGNMRYCHFISNKENIDIGERKYVVGEPGVAEMCNMFCKTLGRGHIHIQPCDSENPNECTHAASDGRRHETIKYGPDETIPKDELTHEVYWNYIGFEDSSSKEERESFKKCPYECCADHGKEKKDPYYCDLDLWHKPLDSSKPSPIGYGTVSKDGHLYNCTHERGGKYHVVFCLDDSGSMQGKPWSDLCVAVRQFIERRMKDSSADLVSIVIHNGIARIACEQIPINQKPDSYLSFQGGSNDFADALKKSYEVLSRTNFSQFTPLLLFLSDGVWNNGEKEMEQIASAYLPKGLIVYTVAFGGADHKKLQGLANIGKGTFCPSPDGIALSKTFVEISSKLGQVISLTTRF